MWPKAYFCTCPSFLRVIVIVYGALCTSKHSLSKQLLIHHSNRLRTTSSTIHISSQWRKLRYHPHKIWKNKIFKQKKKSHKLHNQSENGTSRSMLQTTSERIVVHPHIAPFLLWQNSKEKAQDNAGQFSFVLDQLLRGTLAAECFSFFTSCMIRC